MAREFRRVWKNNPELTQVGEQAVPWGGRWGDMIEALVWATSWQTCRTMQRRLRDTIDIDADKNGTAVAKLWLAIVEDRLAFGDRL